MPCLAMVRSKARSRSVRSRSKPPVATSAFRFSSVRTNALQVPASPATRYVAVGQLPRSTRSSPTKKGADSTAALRSSRGRRDGRPLSSPAAGAGAGASAASPSPSSAPAAAGASAGAALRDDRRGAHSTSTVPRVNTSISAGVAASPSRWTTSPGW